MFLAAGIVHSQRSMNHIQQVSPWILYNELTSPISYQQVSNYLELSNFYARYLYGNKQTKGMKIAHFNKSQGFLASKISEIKYLISGLNPHVLGISEANFFKNQDLNDVQISDYNLHACPTLDNSEFNAFT